MSRKLYLVVLMLFAAAVPVLSAILWELSHNKAILPIEYVRIEGRFQYLARAPLQRALAPLVDANFLTVDVDAVRAAARDLPWVERVQVERVWPDTLVLRLKEQIPYARWRGESLLSQRGEKFAPQNIAAFAALPNIQGPEGQEGDLLEKLKAMSALLARQDLRITALVVNERRAWSVKLAGGMEIVMGRYEPMAAFERFLDSLPVFGKERIQAMQRVDLRYPNGFAVSWKPEVERIPPEDKKMNEKFRRVSNV